MQFFIIKLSWKTILIIWRRNSVDGFKLQEPNLGDNMIGLLLSFIVSVKIS
jgi:hypothetical protein